MRLWLQQKRFYVVIGIVTEQWYAELADKTSLYNEASRSAIPAVRLRPYINISSVVQGATTPSNNLTPPLKNKNLRKLVKINSDVACAPKPSKRKKMMLRLKISLLCCLFLKVYQSLRYSISFGYQQGRSCFSSFL